MDTGCVLSAVVSQIVEACHERESKAQRKQAKEVTDGTQAGSAVVPRESLLGSP